MRGRWVRVASGILATFRGIQVWGIQCFFFALSLCQEFEIRHARVKQVLVKTESVRADHAIN